MRTINTSVRIDADPQTVWDTLVDFESYAEWNPFILRGEGKAEVGSRLSLDIQPPGDKRMTHGPMVLIAEPARQLQWRGKLGFPGLFAAWHEFLLEPSDSGTLLRQRELFQGVLIPLLRNTLKRTEQGFHAMNSALKERVERG